MASKMQEPDFPEGFCRIRCHHCPWSHSFQPVPGKPLNLVPGQEQRWVADALAIPNKPLSNYRTHLCKEHGGIRGSLGAVDPRANVAKKNADGKDAALLGEGVTTRLAELRSRVKKADKVISTPPATIITIFEEGKKIVEKLQERCGWSATQAKQLMQAVDSKVNVEIPEQGDPIPYPPEPASKYFPWVYDMGKDKFKDMGELLNSFDKEVRDLRAQPHLLTVKKLQQLKLLAHPDKIMQAAGFKERWAAMGPDTHKDRYTQALSDLMGAQVKPRKIPTRMEERLETQEEAGHGNVPRHINVAVEWRTTTEDEERKLTLKAIVDFANSITHLNNATVDEEEENEAWQKACEVVDQQNKLLEGGDEAVEAEVKSAMDRHSAMVAAALDKTNKRKTRTRTASQGGASQAEEAAEAAAVAEAMQEAAALKEALKEARAAAKASRKDALQAFFQARKAALPGVLEKQYESLAKVKARAKKEIEEIEAKAQEAAAQQPKKQPKKRGRKYKEVEVEESEGSDSDGDGDAKRRRRQQAEAEAGPSGWQDNPTWENPEAEEEQQERRGPYHEGEEEGPDPFAEESE